MACNRCGARICMIDNPCNSCDACSNLSRLDKILTSYLQSRTNAMYFANQKRDWDKKFFPTPYPFEEGTFNAMQSMFSDQRLLILSMEDEEYKFNSK